MRTLFANSALVVALLLAPPALAQRVQAELACTLTGTDFVYDCVIRLKPAVRGVQVAIAADMPSMPMAHDIKPVRAKPGKRPGEYLARLDLDMPGEWAVKLRLSGAVHDVLVLRYTFPE